MIPTRLGDLHIGPWGAHMLGRTMACAIGRGGIGAKSGEGDGVTPSGRYELRRWLYRRDRLCEPAADAIRPFSVWSDDASDALYNRERPHALPGLSAERLARSDPLYDLVGVLDYNLDTPVPGAGSAIFLHVWRGPRRPTEGCVAFRQSDLLWIKRHLGPRARVVIRAR